MTNTTVTTAPVPFGAVAVYNLVNKVEALRDAALSWNANRVTRKALVRLSDAQLNDIGLTFKDIKSFPLEAGKY